MTEPLETCEVRQINPDAVAHAKKNTPNTATLAKAVTILNAGADLTRLQILLGLSQTELCVCDLAALTQVSESAISHQLRDLRAAKLVKSQKRGRMVFYSLNDHHIQTILENAVEHALEQDESQPGSLIPS
jgi:ArsR family transcriptional regulator, lead/cadmium/zinc/bismuth-responsive transcriptional repressor